MDKSPDAFRTISEVAELLDTPAHVLRFWESRFPQIKPVKRAGGRRYYRPVDLELLSGIRILLHDEGLTIRGVQKILREQGVRYVSGLAKEAGSDDAYPEDLAVDSVSAPEKSSAPIPLFPMPKAALPVSSALPVSTEEDAPTESARSVDGAIDATPAEDRTGPSDPDDDGLDVAALQAAISGPTDEAWKEAQADTTETSETDSSNAEPDQDAGGPAPERAVAEQAAADDADAPLVESRAPSEELPQSVTGVSTRKDDSAAPEAQVPQPQENVADTTSEEGAPLAAGPEGVVEGFPAKEQPSAPDENASSDISEPMQPALEISGNWIPSDLRALYPGAFGDNRERAEAIFARLEALRNRVGDLGRVPRR